LKKDYLIRRESLKKKIYRKKKRTVAAKIRSYFLNKLNSDFLKGFLSKDNSNLKKVKYEIKSDKNVKLRILFLSDLHLEIHDNTAKIKEILKDDESFDFILFGGDFFDSDKESIKERQRWFDLISFLKTKTKNVYGVLGNHDGLEVIKLISKDINLLVNSHSEIGFCSIYGVEDYVTFEETLDFDYIDDSKFNIIISHTPDFIDKIKNSYDLMLSGHTHGGQISLLGFKPVKHCKYSKLFHGKWDKKGVLGITTSGVGCSGYPYRLGVFPEIVIINVN